MGMFWREKRPRNHNAGVSWNKGLCGFVCFSWSTTAKQSRTAHACNFSLCHHYYNTLAFFHVVPWKIFWLDGLVLSRNSNKTITLERRRRVFLTIDGGVYMCTFSGKLMFCLHVVSAETGLVKHNCLTKLDLKKSKYTWQTQPLILFHYYDLLWNH